MVKEHIVINSDRSVQVPASIRKIGVQFDHNVNKLEFDCPRYFDDADLSELKIYVNYILSDGTPGSSIAERIIIDETDPNMIHFTWRITREVTSAFGVLSTLICAKKTDSAGKDIYHWNSDIFKLLSVGEGMENNPSIVEQNPDVINQLNEKVTDHDGKLLEKLSIFQGINNAGKSVIVGSDGNITLGYSQGGSAVEIDNTLTKSGQAADSKSVGDRLLQYDINNSVIAHSTLIIPDSAERVNKGFGLTGNTEQLQTTGKNILQNIPSSWIMGSKTSWGAAQDTEVLFTDDISVAYIILKIKPSLKYSFINNETNKIWVNRIIERNSKRNGMTNHTLYSSSSTNYAKYSFTSIPEAVDIIFQIKKVDKSAITKSDIEQLQIMFYEGENLHYEPYTGGKPSPSPEYPQEIKNVGKWNEEKQKYEVDVKVTGKNLFDVNNMTFGYYNEYAKNLKYDLRDGVLYSSGVVAVNSGESFVIKSPKKPLYLKAKTVGEKASIHVFEFNSMDESGLMQNHTDLMTQVNLPETINIKINQSNKEYIGISFYSTKTNGSGLNDIMISLEDVSYEPYKEQTLTITSDRPITKWDKLVEQDGQIGWSYGSENIVFDGSDDEKWAENSTVGENGFSINYLNNKYNTILCDKLLSFSGGINELPYDSIKEISHTIALRLSNIKTIAELKTWLSENVLNIWHETGMSEFIPLPQSEQEAIRALKTYYPTTVITADGGEVDPNIEVTYVADTKNYIDNKLKAINAALVNVQAQLI